MANKKLLTIEDLIKFCKTNKMYNFSSKETGRPIVVQAIQDFSSAEIEQTDDNKLFAKVRVCHTLLNRNGSFASEESMKEAMPSLKYAPLLANIHQLDDGTWDFHSHDCHIETDESGNDYIVYDEKQVGTFTADEPYLEYDKKMDKTYVIARVAIPEEYTRAADIIREKNGTKVSCELIVYDCSYNAKEKYLQLDHFKFSGCTCLGSEKDGTPIGEGMLGSKLTLEDFSEENNSLVKFNDKMIEFQERLEKLETACLNKDYERKEDEVEVDKEKENFDEVTETEEVTVTDEATEEEVTVTENASEETVDEASEDSVVANEDATVTEEDVEETDSAETDIQFEAMTRTFEISHDDVRYALYNLLSSYEEADNEWYYITNVYDTYFVYESWNGGTIFGQKYTKENDNVSLNGERYNLHKEFLTDSEYAELQSMRSNYESLKEFKETVEKNELRAQKENVLNSEQFAVLLEKDENGEYKNSAFAELVFNMDNYSLTDLEKEAKVILADHLINGGNFALNNEATQTNVTKFQFNYKDNKPKSKAYGTLFN